MRRTLNWGGETHNNKKAKPKKKVATKSKRRTKEPEPEEDELDDSDDDDFDINDFLDDKPKKTEKKTKKSVVKRKPKPKTEKPKDDDELPWDDKEEKADEKPETKTEEAAKEFGIDLAFECPVCRSVNPCDCQEEDRSFIRRTRFEEDVKKVALCSVCKGPLSVLYIKKPNATKPPYRLTQFVATWGCVTCAGDSLATIALRSMDRK